MWLYNLKLLTKEALQAKMSELSKLDFHHPSLIGKEPVTIAGFHNRDAEED